MLNPAKVFNIYFAVDSGAFCKYLVPLDLFGFEFAGSRCSSVLLVLLWLWL